MKRSMIIITLAIMCLTIFAEEPQTLVKDVHRMWSNLGGLEIPLKVTYTISEDKAFYVKGDKIVVNATFEYLTDHPQYIEGEYIEIELMGSSKIVTKKINGPTKFILDDDNRTVSISEETTYKKFWRGAGVLSYSCIISGRLAHWKGEAFLSQTPEGLQAVEAMYNRQYIDFFSLDKQTPSPKFEDLSPFDYKLNQNRAFTPFLRYTNLKLLPEMIPFSQLAISIN